MEKLINHVHVVLTLLIFSCINCDRIYDNDRLPSSDKNDNSKIERNVGSQKLPSSTQNSSVNENELKNSAPVWSSKVNSTTVMEGFFIFAGLSIAVVLYFTVKAIRLRRRRCRVRKYGLLTSREDVEMTPLGEEEDDEDSTVFDINDHPHSSTRP